jgi:soluble lytic murein transglycosylase-like protein
MTETIERVLARIGQIRGLLSEASGSNEGFGRQLQRTSARPPAGPAAKSTPESDPAAPGTPEIKAAAAATPETLSPLIAEASARTGLPDDLISAVVSAESGYRPDAVSRTGALGLMQLMPGTARSLGVDDPLDARQNVLGGSEYLREQLQRFGSVEKALAAYNAGPRAVERYDGVPPYPETQNYVRRVIETLRRLSHRRE